MLAEHEDKAKDKRKDITMLASVFVVITGMIGKLCDEWRGMRDLVNEEGDRVDNLINVSAMDLVSRYRVLNRATPQDKMEIARKFASFL